MKRGSAALALAFVIATAHAARGDEVRAITPKESKSAPPAPVSASAATSARAVAEAKAEIQSLEERYAAEAKALADRVAEATAAVLAISDEEAALRRRLAELGSEIDRAEEQLLEAQIADDKAKARAAQREQELKSEISSQGFALKDRVKNSLLAAQHPEFQKEIALLEDSETFTVEERLAALLGLFERVLEMARTVERSRLTVQVGGPRGELAMCDALRLGLVGGVYHHSATGEGGLLAAASDSRGHFVGRAERLTPEDQAAIAALIKEPAHGGVIPFDVSGGLVLTAMRSDEAEHGIFARFGFVLWPLLGVGLIGVFMIFAFGHRLRSAPERASKVRKAARTAEAANVPRAVPESEASDV
ncbi:MAG: hypothetical protein L0Z55_01160 [Planctomycetes bacterium]|nr:hypothetical protein [Planctomycetota bacterium]